MWIIGDWPLCKKTRFTRVYNSMNNLRLFQEILIDIKVLAESLNSIYNLCDISWPSSWRISNEVHSVQQTNYNDCGVFTMLNAFFVSRGIVKPNLITDYNYVNIYRNSLGFVCLNQVHHFYSRELKLQDLTVSISLISKFLWDNIFNSLYCSDTLIKPQILFCSTSTIQTNQSVFIPWHRNNARLLFTHAYFFELNAGNRNHFRLRCITERIRGPKGQR